MNTPHRIHRIISVTCIAIGLAGSGWGLYVSGFDLSMQARFLAILLVTVVMPGYPVAVWAARTPWLARVAAAYVCGMPLHLLGWLAGMISGLPLLIWLVPPLLGLVAAVLFRRRLAREWHGQRYRLPLWGHVAITGMWVVLIYRFVGFWATQPPGTQATHLYADLYWHQGINAASQYRVPFTDPQVLTESLNYHWLANAHVGALARGTGIDPTYLTTLAWPMAGFAAAIGLAIGMATYLARNASAGVVAAAMVTLPPKFALDPAIDAGTTSNFLMLSPSHMFSLPVTLGLIWLLVIVIQESRSRWSVAAPAFILLLLMSQGAKASTLPVVLCGLLCAFFIALVTRRRRLRLAALLGLVLAVLIATWPVFGGGGGGSEFRILGGVQARPIWRESAEAISHYGANGDLVLLSGFTLLLAANHLWALSALAGFRWRHLSSWFLVGVIGSALGVTFVILHPGQSQLYFAFGVQPLIAVAAAAGIVILLRGRRHRWLLPVGVSSLAFGAYLASHQRVDQLSIPLVGGQLLCITLLAGLIAVSGGLWRWRPTLAVAAVGVAAFSMGGAVNAGWEELRSTTLSTSWAQAELEVEPPAYALSDGQMAALSHVADSFPVNAVIATNVHCRTAPTTPTCEQRGFWVAGLGERQVFLGAWAYSSAGRSTHGEPPTGHHVTNPYPDAELLALNESAFYEPSPAILEELADHGVTHLFADHLAGEISPSLADLCDVQFSNQDVTVCRLR